MVAFSTSMKSLSHNRNPASSRSSNRAPDSPDPGSRRSGLSTKMLLEGDEASLEIDDPESRRVAAALLRHHNSELHNDEESTSLQSSEEDADNENSEGFGVHFKDICDSGEFFSLNANYNHAPTDLSPLQSFNGSETALEGVATGWLPSASKSLIADYRSQIKRAESGHDRYALKGPFWMEVGALRDEAEILRCELKAVRLQRQVQDQKLRVCEIASRLFYRTAFGCHSTQQDAYVYRSSQQVCGAIEASISDSTSIACILLHHLPAFHPSDSMLSDCALVELDAGAAATSPLTTMGSGSSLPESSDRFRIAAVSRRLAATLGRSRNSIKNDTSWRDLLAPGAPADDTGTVVVSTWLQSIEAGFIAAFPLEDQYQVVPALRLRGKRQFGGAKALACSALLTPIVVCNQLYVVLILAPLLIGCNSDDPATRSQKKQPGNEPAYCTARLRANPQLACYRTHDGTLPAAVSCADDAATPDTAINPPAIGASKAASCEPGHSDCPKPSSPAMVARNEVPSTATAAHRLRQGIANSSAGSLPTVKKKKKKPKNPAFNHDRPVAPSEPIFTTTQPTTALFSKLPLWEDLHQLFRGLELTAVERYTEAYSVLESPSSQPTSSARSSSLSGSFSAIGSTCHYPSRSC